MKIRYAALSAIIICISACNKSTDTISRLQQAMTDAPIQPIHLRGDSTHIFLTDYVPSLTSSDWDVVYFDVSEQADMGEETDLYLMKDEYHYVPTLTLAKDGNYLSIAALPDLPHKQGLITTGCTKNTIRFAFKEAPKNPHFTILWQNIEIQNPNLEETGGEYTLNIPD
ncbi:MAG TPA: hypothetical protein DIW30_05985 [Bacteroidales bacterium]|nr:hypothetical protein [Bacteroidales bacterium]